MVSLGTKKAPGDAWGLSVGETPCLADVRYLPFRVKRRH